MIPQFLQDERAILVDPKADLVRRLQALYSLKTAAFEVHPRIVQNDEELNNNKSEKKEELSAEEKAKKDKENEELIKFVVEAYHAGVDTTHSVLLQHELLYNLGQFGAKESIPVCAEVIKDYKRYHEVSRHEAIEAIGAIGYPEIAVPALKEVMAGLPKEAATAPILESAQLAYDRLELVAKHGQEYVLKQHAHRDFYSIDPAPPLQAVASASATPTNDLAQLRKIILDESAHLFERYKAMFALRNINTEASVAILCESLVSDKSSCLFRHEVAFVLGQMEYSSSIPALKIALLNEDEHAMVRHEAAESLGAIGNKECKEILQEYVKHKEPLVSDSCYAALVLMEQGGEETEEKEIIKH